MPNLVVAIAEQGRCNRLNPLDGFFPLVTYLLWSALCAEPCARKRGKGKAVCASTKSASRETDFSKTADLSFTAYTSIANCANAGALTPLL